MAFKDFTNLKKRGTFFYFESTITNKTWVLKAFIKNLSDQYNSNWAEERVHGRMDPIPTYSGTARKIAFDLELVAGSHEEAFSNLEKVQTLIQSMYPKYDYGHGALGMSQIPLMKVKYANLIQSNHATGKSLLGYIPSFQFDPNFDDLMFYDNYGNVYPKIINFSFEMGVIHQHTIHADDPNFPYRAASSTFKSGFAKHNTPTSQIPDLDENALRGIKPGDKKATSTDADNFTEEEIKRMRGLSKITQEGAK